MLYNIVKKGTGDDGEDVDLSSVMQNKTMEKGTKKALIMKGKVRSVARMNKMYSTLREESENILKLRVRFV